MTATATWQSGQGLKRQSLIRREEARAPREPRCKTWRRERRRKQGSSELPHVRCLISRRRYRKRPILKVIVLGFRADFLRIKPDVVFAGLFRCPDKGISLRKRLWR